MNPSVLQRITSLQHTPASIRNVSILAHVDHGKTSLSDSLISSNNIISSKLAGTIRYLDSRPDEQLRQITMKSSSISLLYQDAEQSDYLINLIDCPGHVDFSVEVSAALRLCDGAMVLVDAVEGICTQTYIVMKQAWQEKVKTCLVINKVDKLVMELNLTPLEAYQRLYAIVESANAIVGGFLVAEKMNDEEEVQESEEDELYFSPDKDNVAFCSAVDRWSFIPSQFASMYAQKLGMNERAFAHFIWGDFYFNPKAKKVTKTPPTPSSVPMFVQFILAPIWKIYETVYYEQDEGKLKHMLKAINLQVSETAGEPKRVIVNVMSAWLPIEKSIMKLITRSLPSPVDAQPIRIDTFSKELASYSAYDSICACDPEAPVTSFVSKMMPVDPVSSIVRLPGAQQEQHDSLIGFARVYSGTMKTGTTYFLVDGDEPIEFFLEHIYLLMGQNLVPLKEVPAGNILGIGNLQDLVFKTATIATEATCPNFSPMVLYATPIVKVAIESQNIYDMQKLIQGLQILNKSDGSVEIYMQENGEHILAAWGEVHLQRCIEDLETTFAKVPVNVSEPIVNFKETVALEKLGEIHTEITPNGRCNISVRAIVLPEDLVKALDESKDTIKYLAENKVKEDMSQLHNKILTAIDGHEFLSPIVSDKLIAFGPKRCGNNILINMAATSSFFSTETAETNEKEEEEKEDFDETKSETSSIATASTIASRDLNSALLGGFDLATLSGPLCDEPLQGVWIIIEEVSIKGEQEEGKDPYGPFRGQIMSTMRDACREAIIKAQARIVEGIYTCTLQTTQEIIGKIYTVLSRRRGKIYEEEIQEGTNFFNCKAILPVAESFGFADELRRLTSGAAIPQLIFSHWQMIPEDPYHTNTTEELYEEFGDQPILPNVAKIIVNQVRNRKGLPTDEKLTVVEKTLTKMKQKFKFLTNWLSE